MARIYTIGHSTRSLEELITALKGHGITTLVDIRAFPMSRRLPHFNRESLEQKLPQRGIEYVWMKELGGRRKKLLAESPNTALRNESFRNYADYMMTEEFERGIGKLIEVVKQTAGPLRLAPLAQDFGCGLNRPQNASTSTSRSPDPSASSGQALRKRRSEKDGERFAQDDLATQGGTAIMCAERVYFHCHRMLVSDYLTAHGHAVFHIDDEKRAPRQHTLMAQARMVDGKLVYDGGNVL